MKRSKHLLALIASILTTSTGFAQDTPKVSEIPPEAATPNPVNTQPPQVSEPPPQPSPTPAQTQNITPVPTQILAPTPTPSPQETLPARRVRFAAGAYLSSAKKLKFDSITVANGTDSATGSLENSTDASGGVFIEINEMPPHAMGYSLGVAYERKREIDSGTMTLNGQTVSSVSSGEKTTFDFFLLYVNAIYRFDSIYIPFGLNYSFPRFEQGSNATGVLTSRSDLGAQFGIGIYLNDSVQVEALYRNVNVDLKLRNAGTNSDINVDYNTGSLSGGLVQLKISF